MAAPTPILQTLQDDANKIIVKIVIPDGGDADVNKVTVVDVSTFTTGRTVTNVKVAHVYATVADFGVKLFWDADTDVNFLYIGNYSNLVFDMANQSTSSPPFYINNNAGTGKTGDILLSTVGIGTTEGGTIILELDKVN